MPMNSAAQFEEHPDPSGTRSLRAPVQEPDHV